jgi:hypothetical protein
MKDKIKVTHVRQRKSTTKLFVVTSIKWLLFILFIPIQTRVSLPKVTGIKGEPESVYSLTSRGRSIKITLTYVNKQDSD